VFSDKTMDGFRQDDPQVVAEIERNFHHWDNVDVFFKDRRIISGGHGFCGIGRMKLLQIFQARARELGVTPAVRDRVPDPDDYAREYDLVIGADGVNSTTRGKYESISTPHRRAQVPLHLAGHQDEAECLHLRLQGDALGLVQPARLPVQRGMGHLHRRDARGNLAQGRLDKMEPDQSIAFCERSLPTC
jgi:anthraniloyl-CoA monooxygenase